MYTLYKPEHSKRENDFEKFSVPLFLKYRTDTAVLCAPRHAHEQLKYRENDSQFLNI